MGRGIPYLSLIYEISGDEIVAEVYIGDAPPSVLPDEDRWQRETKDRADAKGIIFFVGEKVY